MPLSVLPMFNVHLFCIFYYLFWNLFTMKGSVDLDFLNMRILALSSSKNSRFHQILLFSFINSLKNNTFLPKMKCSFFLVFSWISRWGPIAIYRPMVTGPISLLMGLHILAMRHCCHWTRMVLSKFTIMQTTGVISIPFNDRYWQILTRYLRKMPLWRSIY